jgi:hypothetical protein
VTDLSGNTWWLLAGASAASILAILHALATSIRNQVKVHDLKMNVARLRIDYAQRAKEVAETTSVIEAIPIEEFEAAEKQRQADEKMVQEHKKAAA